MKHLTALLALAALSDPIQGCITHLIPKEARAVKTELDPRAATNPAYCLGHSVSTNQVIGIKNAQIFDGTKFTIPQNVLIVGNKILTVGGALPFGATVVDGTGKYLIPGLIDSHVHPSDCSSLSELASWGVTTAINMNCEDYSTCQSMKGQLGVSDFITASFFAIGKGTVHQQFFGVPDSETVTANTDLSALVQYAFGNGSDFFKIVAEANGPTQAQQNQIVQLVNGYSGKYTATHAALAEFYQQAITSKAYAIQHTPADLPLTTTQINQIKSQGQFVTPTLEFYQIAFNNPVIAPLAGFPAGSSYQVTQNNVAAMHKAGIPIAVGTDSIGSIPGLLNYPYGQTLHCELQNLVAAGFGNAEVLKAATSGAARLHKLTDRGSIAIGQRADLLLLNSNPITNITNSLDVAAAWAGGIQIQTIKATKGASCNPITF